MTTPGLSNAYAIRTPDDCARVYAEWAASYDDGFAAGMGYRLPAHVAAAFLAAGGSGPVLDVGAGTGLCAQALRDLGLADPIDGVDLSPEMLERAADKAVYRALHRADVTRPLPFAGPYRGMVSSGTFTHGHVGPVAFGPLLAVMAPGALMAFSVNAGIWDELGFAAALDALADRLHPPEILDVPIYGAEAEGVDPAHAGDRAHIVLARLR
jgi:predicted TPR repeat methyltransferase